MLPWQQSFLTYFCLSQVPSSIYANFHLIPTSNSLTVAHLNIEAICAYTCDVIIFAESAPFFSRLADNFKPSYLWN